MGRVKEGSYRLKLSVHMLVLNGASVVERALRPLEGIADEVVFVDTGSNDGTPALIREICNRMTVAWRCISLHPNTHPELYFRDDASTWGFHVPVPFTGRMVLRDWSDARNRGLALCQGDYVLKLDADDECMTPHNILPTLQLLDSNPDIDYIMCPYEAMCPKTDPGGGYELEIATVQDRIWRNKPSVRFQHVMHEKLTGKGCLPDGRTNWLTAAMGLSFRDWRDSSGEGVRLAYRNFKVLLYEYERLVRCGEKFDSYNLYDLGREAIAADPKFALDVLLQAMSILSLDSDLRFDCCLKIGEAYHACGAIDAAAASYCRAVELSPTSPSALLRLGLLQHEMSSPEWKETLISAMVAAKRTACFNLFFSDLKKARELLKGV
jgi:glycosyltransferase involved in cell wall biosynthesis